MGIICSFLEETDRNRRGGGVTIILSNHIRCRVCPDISEGNVESLWIQLYPHTKRAVLLCCVYRSPSDYHFYDNFLVECEKGLLTYCDRLVISILIFHKCHPRKLNFCFRL